MSQPRLLADYAAMPTKRERAAARTENRAGQLGMFEVVADLVATACPVCAGDHDGPCPHGVALTLAVTP